MHLIIILFRWGPWNLPSRLDWLVSEPGNPPVSVSRMLELQAIATVPGFVHECVDPTPVFTLARQALAN